MHCDVMDPALPIAGFLVVAGLTLLARQRRAPRSRVRLALGAGCLLLAVGAALFATSDSVGCAPLPDPQVDGRPAATAPSGVPLLHGRGAA